VGVACAGAEPLDAVLGVAVRVPLRRRQARSERHAARAAAEPAFAALAARAPCRARSTSCR
jgi:hypothetical protein